MTPYLVRILGLLRPSGKADARCRRLPTPRAARNGGAFLVSFAQEFVSLLGRNDDGVLAMAFKDARCSAQNFGARERARTRGHRWPGLNGNGIPARH
jgi:hypothetical protein